MPLIRIDIIKGKSREYKETLSDSVHEALIEAFGIEDWDRFIINAGGITESDKRLLEEEIRNGGKNKVKEL